MPWKECHIVEERMRFIARLLDGEKMAPLCREFGISRVTGYKIFNRYKDCGLDGLYDRSRAPYRQANKLPYQVERTILGIKREHPGWGAPKIRDKIIRQFPMVKPPAVSTVHAALDHVFDHVRLDLVVRRFRVVLGRDQDVLHAHGLAKVVLDGDLALAVRAKVGDRAVLADLCKAAGELVRQGD